VKDSTGLPGLDKILNGILPGDNIVWQTDSVFDFMPYVKPYCEYARNNGKKLVYFRFAKHPAFLSADSGAEIVQLKPDEGFEKFITGMHDVITRVGNGGYYIFDSLSELAVDHFSESMIENFFVLTCPRLLKMECIAYFMIQRNYNLYHATQLISRTTQLILDTYRHAGKEYMHPVKVDSRYSPTMYMLHERVLEEFIPVMDSTVIAEVSVSGPWYGLQSAPSREIGLWDRLFIESENTINSCKRGECSPETVHDIFRRQLRQLIATDEKMLEMGEKHLDLSGLIHIWKRTIGSGMIGGKSVGMLLAHSILKKEFMRYDEIIEKHDSFYIGSDIFYSFLVQNGCWHIRQKQKDPETLFDSLEEAREKIMKGNFPEDIIKRFSDMLDYFGQAPIIVRSSSLLEDNFGNAFSGKYESIFCVNNGPREERLKHFLDAVRIIYASTMSREALAYRAKKGVLANDEQMALLVQRVSGSRHRNVFLPELAGVGVSYNPYTWDEAIEPEAGLLRLVYGLGTRAVDRHDDDYTRIVALNAPDKRPEGNGKDVLKFTQKRVDVLDLVKNNLETSYFTDIIRENPDLRVHMFSEEIQGNSSSYNVINFDSILSGTAFITDMREILAILKKAYANQVDIEFTANFTPDGKYKINLLQCRPQNVVKEKTATGLVPPVEGGKLILKSAGGIVGSSRQAFIDRIIYVVPSVYSKLPEQNRYALARVIGKLAHFDGHASQKTIMLVGPGRWCTRMPSLGVPVSFSEINTASVICELGVMHEGLNPDLSMGTHFFNDMVEMDILYMGVFISRKDNVFNDELLSSLPDSFPEMMPDEKSWHGAIRVIDGNNSQGGRLYLNVDSIKQSGALYLG
jgi:pyruvate,water dikinase